MEKVLNILMTNRLQDNFSDKDVIALASRANQTFSNFEDRKYYDEQN